MMAERLGFGRSLVKGVSVSRPSAPCVWNGEVTRGLGNRHRVRAAFGNGGHERANLGLSSDFDVYAISDLHTDYEENMEWVEQLPDDKYQDDILIVAGDISDHLEIIRKTLSSLVKKFKHVAFIPGNHELWVQGRAENREIRNGNATNSMEKLDNVLECCQELGVIISPTRFGNLWIAPILSWHHQSFDQEPDIAKIPAPSKLTISDYRWCKWPVLGLETPENTNDVVAKHLDALNDDAWLQAAENCDVITFSHFLPRQDLLPEKRFLYYPNMAKAVGSLHLKKRIERINPNIHVFGHSHFGWDTSVDGIRYVQCPLCYPAERIQRTRTIVLYDSPCKNYFGRLLKFDESSGSNYVDWLPACIYSTKENVHNNVLHRKRADTALPNSERSVDVGKEMLSPSSIPVMMAKPERGKRVNPRVMRSFSRPLQGEMREWHAVWSDHYLDNVRNPNIVSRAQWVGKRKRNKVRSES